MNFIWRRYDLKHIGSLFKRIRERRGMDQSEIARLAKVDRATINKFENGKSTSPKTLKLYIDVLQSGAIPPPLIGPNEAAILRNLYVHSKQVRYREEALASIDLQDIASEIRPRELRELVSMLAGQDRPAFIMDPLWFCHAVNEPLLKLFNLTPTSKYLYGWEAWHLLANKLSINSPVRQAHFNPDEYIPVNVVDFFQNAQTYPFLFTAQMRYLLFRLYQLSNKNGAKFVDWWLQASSFSLPFDREALTRTVKYWPDRSSKNMQLIQIKFRIVSYKEVGQFPNSKIPYTFAVWEPFNNQASAIFKQINRTTRSRQIYFAADFDEQRNFHPNRWSEVKNAVR